MQFTRIPYSARSLAIGRVMLKIAPFDPAYGANFSLPRTAAVLAMLTITPRSPCSSGTFCFIKWTADVTTVYTPRAFT